MMTYSAIWANSSKGRAERKSGWRFNIEGFRLDFEEMELGDITEDERLAPADERLIRCFWCTVEVFHDAA